MLPWQPIPVDNHQHADLFRVPGEAVLRQELPIDMHIINTLLNPHLVGKRDSQLFASDIKSLLKTACYCM